MLKITQTSISNNKNENIQDNEIVLFLTEEVEFENITFARLFDLILINADLLDIVYYKTLGGFKIEDFKEDFYSDPIINELDDVDELQFSWLPDISYEKNDNDTLPILSMIIDLSAKNFNDLEVSYSLTFSSLADFKNKPIFINTNFVLHNKEDMPLIEVRRNMTLYDIIKSILTEITYYGNPASRNIFKEEFIRITQDLDLNENVHTLSFDDLFRNIKDELDNDVRPV